MSRERDGIEDPVVVLDGERNIPYQLMIEMLDALRKQGYDGVNLVTSEKNRDG